MPQRTRVGLRQEYGSTKVLLGYCWCFSVKAINGTFFLAKLTNRKLSDLLITVLFADGYFFTGSFLNMIWYLIQALILAAVPAVFVLIAAALVIAALPVR
jgi:hypothetical protein